MGLVIGIAVFLMDDSTIVGYCGPISTALTASLCTVDTTARLSVVLLWSVYVSPQSVVDQLPPAPHGVGQLSSEFGGTRSELCLLSALGSPAPSVSVPGSMTCRSIVSVTSHSDARLALV
jgi:hypothetical protein